MKQVDELILRYPELEPTRESVEQSAAALIQCFRNGGKLLICGNGGSAADADHIAGELLKGFEKKRPLPSELRLSIERECGTEGKELCDSLQMGLPVINLATHSALHTAFANDCDYVNVFAQLVLAYGKEGDVLLGISTSGNSENVLRAAAVARAKHMKTIALTGAAGGKLKAASGIAICVPSSRTYQIQELHLPVYHALCLAAEDALFG